MNFSQLAVQSLTVADLVRASPAAVRVLQRHGIDFCCGGKRPLADACAQSDVAIDQILQEVDDASTIVTFDWMTLSPQSLCDAVVARFHAPLPEELDRLLAMANRVLLVHGAKDPARLQDLRDTVGALRDDLLPHLQTEEVELFPLIQRHAWAQASVVRERLETEHEAVGALLKRARVLTHDFTPPLAACGTWRALYQGLHDLEKDTHEHIHVENNVLFAAIVQQAA